MAIYKPSAVQLADRQDTNNWKCGIQVAGKWENRLQRAPVTDKLVTRETVGVKGNVTWQ